MNEWDNSTAPQIGDSKRVSPGCFLFFFFMCVLACGMLVKLAEWFGHWAGNQ